LQGVRPLDLGYSIFDSALYRILEVKWLFHQEKATFTQSPSVNM